MSEIVTDLILARLTGEGWIEKDTGSYPTDHEVGQRAYHLYETRGRVDGHDVDDWLLAEKELRGY